MGHEGSAGRPGDSLELDWNWDFHYSSFIFLLHLLTIRKFTFPVRKHVYLKRVFKAIKRKLPEVRRVKRYNISWTLLCQQSECLHHKFKFYALEV